MTTTITHKSVLSQEVTEALSLREGMTVVDGTFGAGGHSLLIAKMIGRSGHLIAFDQDASVFDEAIVRELCEMTEFTPVRENFRNMKTALKKLGVKKIDGALFDLGLSSTQLERSGRGFSFQRDEPLIMTFQSAPDVGDVTASDIVNRWSEESIATILRGFGEERFARSIAKNIVSARQGGPIRTTGELVEVIHHATPSWYRRSRTHFATRTFQAIRMAVNDELGAIEEGVQNAVILLGQNGRIAVVTFHSVEDRAVKTLFRKLVNEGQITLINKKPLIPSKEEVRKNPRARSAKLRIAAKTQTSQTLRRRTQTE